MQQADRMGMKINILGAGNVAYHLAKAFKSVGYQISIWNHSEKNLRLFVEEGYRLCSTDMGKLPQDADVYIISVKDSAVRDVARALSDVVLDTNATVVHTAGSLSIDILTPFFSHCGVMYPMQTFTKLKALDYSQIPFFIEGQTAVLNIIGAVLKPISHNVFVADSHKRKMLHLASVFACNFVNHNIAIAHKILERAGLPSSVIVPLVKETMVKLESCSPIEAQTGPAVREDYNIIGEHIKLLDGFPLEKEIYQQETNSIIDYKNKYFKKCQDD